MYSMANATRKGSDWSAHWFTLISVFPVHSFFLIHISESGVSGKGHAIRKRHIGDNIDLIRKCIAGSDLRYSLFLYTNLSVSSLMLF